MSSARLFRDALRASPAPLGALATLLLAAGCADDPQAPPADAPTHDLVFEGVLEDVPELLRLDASTGGIARVLPPGTMARDPSPSPDGRLVAFVVADYESATGDIFVCNRDGSNVRRLTTGPELDDQPAWSPDGLRLVFRSFRTQREGDIWIMDADGGNQRNLTPDPLPGVTDERSPCWSPDGGRIAYISNAGGNRDLWTMASDGSDPQRLVITEGLEAEPAWSPDGAVIACRYSSPVDGSHIHLVPATGGEPVPLASAGEQRMPAWSPDGTWLVFVGQATPGDRPDLWQMRADGTGAQVLVGSEVPGGCVNPAFLRRAHAR